MDSDESGSGVERAKRAKLIKKKQKYRQEWQNEFKWLMPVKGNCIRASCKCCNVQFSAEISVIKRHDNSEKHKTLAKVILNSNQPTIIEKFNANTVERQIKTAELKISSFLIEHNIAYLTTEHLTPLLKSCFPDSAIAKGLHLSRTKTTNLVKNILAPIHYQDIVTILKAVKFSILIDESTDISSTKTLAICVRFYSKDEKRIVSRFLTLIQLFHKEDAEGANQGATAENIFNKLVEVFTNANIPLDNIIGYAADGCNVMFGGISSVATKLKNKLNGIVTNKCICHSLHLCASEACKNLTRECEALPRDIYNFFNTSAKRQAQYGEFQKFCNIEPHKLLKPAQTRWLSLTCVVKRIIEQWNALLLYFQNHYQEHRLIQSENIFHSLQNPQNRMFFLFLDWILPKFTTLNSYFQSEKVVITELYNKMKSTFIELLSIYMDMNYITGNNIHELNPEERSKFLPLNKLYLGLNVLNKMNTLDDIKRDDFLIRCQKFVITACVQIKKRFDFGDPLLPKLAFLNANSTDSPDSLVDILNLCQRLTKDLSSEEIQAIDDEWRYLKMNQDVIDKYKHLNVDVYWAEIGVLEDATGNRSYKNVSRFCLELLTYPHSNADVERVFSKINLVKTKLRSNLLTDTVNSMLLTSQLVKEQGNCTNFEPNNTMISSMFSANIYKKENDDVSESENEVIFET